MGILLSLSSANFAFICLFLPSLYGCDLASWSCIFQITVVMKSSLNLSVKGSDGHKFTRSLPVSSVKVLQISRQLRKTLGFFLVSVVSHLLLSVCWRRVGHTSLGKGRTGSFLISPRKNACNLQHCQVSFRRKQ